MCVIYTVNQIRHSGENNLHMYMNLRESRLPQIKQNKNYVEKSFRHREVILYLNGETNVEFVEIQFTVKLIDLKCITLIKGKES